MHYTNTMLSEWQIMRAFIVSLRMMVYLGFNFAWKRARSSLPNLFHKFFIAFRESLAILLDQFGLFSSWN